jgi:hypothetical protein
VRSIRLTARRALGKGGEPREGRVVGDVQASVIPKGMIRSHIRANRRLIDAGAVSEDADRELARRAAPEPGQSSRPEAWSVERGRRQLADLLSRAERSD